MRSSLRGTLALGLTAGVIVVLSLSYFALHLVIRGEIYDHLDKDLLLRMRGVASYAAAHPGAESIAPFMPRFRTGAHEDVFQIWDSQHRTLARSDSTTSDLPYLQGRVDAPTYQEVVLPDGHSGRAIVQRFILPATDTRGSLTVVTAEETEEFKGLENRIHGMLLAGTITAIAAMLLIAQYSVRRGLRPVDDLAHSLERVNLDGPDSALDTGPLPTELQPVATSFSRLLARLLDALSREKRYARNVAHELRNPLAEIRLVVDVAAGSSSPDALRSAINDIGATASDMERTVEVMLALTRYEAGLELPQPEPVDLCAELRRQWATIAAQAKKKDLDLQLSLPEEYWVHADSALLRRLLANLLGNSVAHSPRSSPVHLQLSMEGELRLINSAPQLTPTDVPHLGERFFRIDNGDSASHSGLGLSLASAMSKVLGLRLHLQLRDDGFLVATIAGFRPLTLSSAGTQTSLDDA
jgi:two-component system sensor histidine kinase QseC